MKRLLSGRRLAALCVLAALAVAGLGAYAAWLFRYSGVSEVEPVADANEPDADYTLDITPYYDVGALYVRQTIEFTNPGEALDIRLPDGTIRATAEEVKVKEHGKEKADV